MTAWKGPLPKPTTGGELVSSKIVDPSVIPKAISNDFRLIPTTTGVPKVWNPSSESTSPVDSAV